MHYPDRDALELEKIKPPARHSGTQIAVGRAEDGSLVVRANQEDGIARGFRLGDSVRKGESLDRLDLAAPRSPKFPQKMAEMDGSRTHLPH
jgi:hypothetical protein